MGFEVAYDPGENITIVKAVEKHPVLYNSKKYPAIEFRGVADKAWSVVAKELGVSEGYCKQRWTNIRGCFKRYLRKKATRRTRRTYYLADYLNFLLPFMDIDNRIAARGSAQNTAKCSEASDGDGSDDLDVSNDFELKLVDSDGEEECYFITTNSTSSDDSPETLSERNPDWDFFSSLLPDVQKMTAKQKVKFRNSLISAVDTALYGEDF